MNSEKHDIPEGFTAWDGGECPVDMGDSVDLVFRGGTRRFAVMLCCHLRWKRINHPSDIIAYRLIEQPKPKITGDTVLTEEIEYKHPDLAKWYVYYSIDGSNVREVAERSRVRFFRYKDDPDSEFTYEPEKENKVDNVAKMQDAALCGIVIKATDTPPTGEEKSRHVDEGTGGCSHHLAHQFNEKDPERIECRKCGSFRLIMPWDTTPTGEEKTLKIEVGKSYKDESGWRLECFWTDEHYAMLRRDGIGRPLVYYCDGSSNHLPSIISEWTDTPAPPEPAPWQVWERNNTGTKVFTLRDEADNDRHLSVVAEDGYPCVISKITLKENYTYIGTLDPAQAMQALVGMAEKGGE